MAILRQPAPALLLTAIFSQYDAALQWATDRIAVQWGTIAKISPNFDHEETSYYDASMGKRLKKRFVLLGDIFDPSRLPTRKLESNVWETELAQSGRFAVARPVNIDPGYLTLTKLVLASAKDRAHRLYMAQGVYAEECLYYLDGRWQPRPWTYPDYRRADFQLFFASARDYLKALQAENARTDVEGGDSPVELRLERDN